MPRNIYIRLILCLFVCFSCSNIEDDVRSVVRGKVTDLNGVALGNISVSIGSEYNSLGFSKTDAQGNFEFVSLRSRNNYIKVKINSLESNGIYGQYAKNFSNQPFKELYDLGTIALPQLATLQFGITKTSADENIITWTLEFLSPQCEEYDDPESEQNYNDCLREIIINRTNDNADPNYKIMNSVVKGTTAKFTYQLNNGPTQIVEIPLSEISNTYSFEF